MTPGSRKVRASHVDAVAASDMLKKPARGLAPWMLDKSLLPRTPVDRMVRAMREAGR